MSDISQVKIPDGRTFNIKDTVARDNSVYLVIGKQTGKTGSWTGDSSYITDLYDGLTIAYWLPYDGVSNSQVTLSINSGTAVAVYYSGTTRLTTHYAAGNIIYMTYRVNANIGANQYTGWWAQANYDTNTRTSTGTTNKADTKLFLVGGASQSSYTTTYTNSKVYIDTDNCLYSNSEKVAVLNSPAFTGTPTAPTASTDSNSTQIATTAYVTSKAVAISQGTSNAGKFLIVNSSGNVEATEMSVWQGGSY